MTRRSRDSWPLRGNGVLTRGPARRFGVSPQGATRHARCARLRSYTNRPLGSSYDSWESAQEMRTCFGYAPWIKPSYCRDREKVEKRPVALTKLKLRQGK